MKHFSVANLGERRGEAPSPLFWVKKEEEMTGISKITQSLGPSLLFKYLCVLRQTLGRVNKCFFLFFVHYAFFSPVHARCIFFCFLNKKLRRFNLKRGEGEGKGVRTRRAALFAKEDYHRESRVKK